MTEELVDRFRSMAPKWAEGDFSDVIALFAEDVVMSAYQPEGVLRFEGRDAVLRFLAEFNAHWESFRVEASEVLPVSETAILVEGQQIGVGLESGVEISEPVFIVTVFRGDEVVGNHWHVEREKALQAAGLGSEA